MKVDVLRNGGYNTAAGGLDQTGGTLAGPLTLSRNPVEALEALERILDYRFLPFQSGVVLAYIYSPGEHILVLLIVPTV